MLVKGAPGNKMYVIPLPVFLVSVQIECPATILARYVAIGLLTLNQLAYLMLQEVEVYAVPGELKWASVMRDIKYKGWYKIADILQKILAGVICYSLPQKYWNIWNLRSKHSHLTFLFAGNGLAPNTNKYCGLYATFTCSVMGEKCNLQDT